MGDSSSSGHPSYGTFRPVTEQAGVLLAENPSPMTLEGTNTWLLRAPEGRESVVVDPGPAGSSHVSRILASGPIAGIVLTHYHFDHVQAVPDLLRHLDVPVWAANPSLVQNGFGLRGRRQGVKAKLAQSIVRLEDGQQLDVAGVRFSVLATPGHTSDSVSLVLLGQNGKTEAVLTGDMILGRGSTVLERRTGDLGDYLRSMRTLIELGRGIPGLPGHGPELADVAAAARMGLTHREVRLNQVRAALTKLGPNASAWRVVREVYADVDRKLWPAAWSSTRVQLKYLRETGEM